jgi:hypothetical protein
MLKGDAPDARRRAKRPRLESTGRFGNHSLVMTRADRLN